jgi:hypothetical protein
MASEDRPLRAAIKLTRENVDFVRVDVERTTTLRPGITVDDYRGVVRITYDSSYTTPSLSAWQNPEALAETADYLQDHVVDDLRRPWPVCLAHDKGVYAEVHDGRALWWCRYGGHPVAQVGHLDPALLAPAR